MAGVVNLRTRRKQAARAAARAKGCAAAARHGRTKPQKQAEQARVARDVARLDGHKRTP